MAALHPLLKLGQPFQLGGRHSPGRQFGDLGQGAIVISVRREGDMLHCEVVDDGRGLRPGHKEGVGFANARQRLAHLYGDRHTFSVRGAPGEGVRVTMAIPFNPSQRIAAD